MSLDFYRKPNFITWTFYFKIWNSETFTCIKSTKFSSNVNKIFLNLTNSNTNQSNLVVAGIDIKLYNEDLTLLDEFTRKSRDNSVKFMIIIKNDRIVLATNSDIEMYEIVSGQTQSQQHLYESNSNNKNPSSNIYSKIKELKKYTNIHNDSILYLANLSENTFGSSSSDGKLIIWQSETLVKYLDIRPFNEIIGINCFKTINEVNIS